ncbi:MAG: hypothetical protein R3Y63_12040 [Eubacteriales bacterium]
MKLKMIMGGLCVLATCVAGGIFVVKNKEEIKFHLSNAETV